MIFVGYRVYRDAAPLGCSKAIDPSTRSGW